MEQYLPILVLMVLALLFASLSLVASGLLATQRPNPTKLAPYECGIVPGRDQPQRFPVRFYLVAMLFIVFDIEIVFLYPYVISYGSLGLFGLGAITIFVLVVFESFVYLISKGAIDWGPLQVNRRQDQDSLVSSERTAASTIRRVGAEGRFEEAA